MKISAGGTIKDKSRAGRPLIISEYEQLKVIAFFCQTEPLPGCNSISLSWAASYFKNNLSFIGKPISISTISRILRKNNLRPHLHKYFLQITDPYFFDKMSDLINIYKNPPEHLFCFDECPGIQALKKVAPPLPVGKAANGGKYSDPTHNRMGTIDLLAFLNVKTGEIFSKCKENHNSKTFIELFIEHVSLLPDDAEIHYVFDNLATHSTPDFCKAVAKLCNVKYPEKELTTKLQRQEWLKKRDKRIVIHFTPFHGSWLNMIEIWFGIMGKKCLCHNSFDSTKKLVDFINKFIETWNNHFAHPFNWKYDGKGLHQIAVKRFIVHLSIENQKMDISFLNSQVKLMTNICLDYFSEVKLSVWESLLHILEQKDTFIEKIIEISKNQKIKKNISNLLQEFHKMLKLDIQKNESQKIAV